ncbi:MAG: hypothetical protein ACP5VS_08730 [Desulfomonilaceae bacterium]
MLGKIEFHIPFDLEYEFAPYRTAYFFWVDSVLCVSPLKPESGESFTAQIMTKTLGIYIYISKRLGMLLGIGKIHLEKRGDHLFAVKTIGAPYYPRQDTAKHPNVGKLIDI